MAAFTPNDLRAVPLFAAIPDDHLDRLVGAFERRSLAAGEVLFEMGSLADRLFLLVDGRVEVRRPGDGDPIQVRPVAPVGELGALAGLRRATTAVAAEASRVLSIGTTQLIDFFEKHGDIGLRFHRNLVDILADKVVRDRRRLEQVQQNLVHTQKAMKRLREALLPAEDTALHRMMFEELDALVEHNRRGHYLVDVPRALPSRLRIEGGERAVLRMSNERLDVADGTGSLPTVGGEYTAVLEFEGGEFPVTGVVEAHDDGGGASLSLDLLIDEYAQLLERHLVKLQLLDVVL